MPKFEFNGNTFTSQVMDGEMTFNFIHDQLLDKNIAIGWILIATHDDSPGKCSIVHIQVRSKFRHRGYGKLLVEMLQNTFDNIETDYIFEMLDEPSTQLLMKCGFHIQPQINKRQAGKLLWKRGK